MQFNIPITIPCAVKKKKLKTNADRSRETRKLENRFVSYTVWYNF